MFHESFKKQFSWNLILRHTVKLALNDISWNTLKEKFHIVSFPLRDVSVLCCTQSDVELHDFSDSPG